MRIFILGILFGVFASQASAQEILKKRIEDLGNRVESVFTDDKVGHRVQTLKNRRDLNASLLDKKLAEIHVLRIELMQIDNQLYALDPNYIPGPIPLPR